MHRVSTGEARKLGLVGAGKPRKKAEKPPDPYAAFDRLCELHGLPQPVHEYPFACDCKTPLAKGCKCRRWRFDCLFAGLVALEIEGVSASGTRHQRIRGFLGDMDKYNAAALRGYLVLRCTPRDVESGAAFGLVRQALGGGE